MSEHDQIHIECEHLETRLSQLRSDFKNVTAALRTVQQQMSSPGIPPPDGLAEQIQNAAENFERLRDAYLDCMRRLNMPTTGSIKSLNDLKSLLPKIKEAITRAQDHTQRDKALAMLARVALLRLRAEESSTVLDAAKQNAEKLSHNIRLADSEQAVDSLTKELSNFDLLLSFVQDRETLPDDVYSQIEDQLTAVFGRPLVTLVTRGKITLLENIGVESGVRTDMGTDKSIPTAPTVKNTAVFEQLPPQIGQLNTSTSTDIGNAAVETQGIEGEYATDVTVAESAIESVNITAPGTMETAPISTQVIVPNTVPAEKPAAFPIARSQTGSPAENQESKILAALTEPTLTLPAGKTAREVAQTIQALAPERRITASRELVWALLSESNTGLAFALDSVLAGVSSSNVTPPWLLRVVALSRHVQTDASEISFDIAQALLHYNSELDRESQNDYELAEQLLLAGALLLPALFSPSTGAATLLDNMHSREGLTHFYGYAQEIARVGEHIRGLDVYALHQIKDHTAWQTQVEELQKRTKAWYAQAQGMTMTYAPTTKIWRKWLEPSYPIHVLLAPILENNLAAIPQAKEMLKRLYKDGGIQTEVNYTDKKILKRQGPTILPNALSQMSRRTREAGTLLDGWISLQSSPFAQDRGFLHEQAEQLRKSILQKSAPVLEELAEFARRNSNLPIAAAVTQCKNAVERIGKLFSSGAGGDSNVAEPKYLLGGELILVPDLQLDQNWDIVVDSRTLDSLIEFIARGNTNIHTAYQQHAQRRDHIATARLIEYSRLLPGNNAAVESLSQNRSRDLKACQEALVRTARATLKEIDDAVALGLLPEQDQLEMVAKVQLVELNASQTESFEAKHLQLDKVKQEIELKRQDEVRAVRNRLEQLDSPPTLKDAARIRAVIEHGDVLTANEYIDLVSKREALPDVEAEQDAFSAFFPDTLLAIEDYLEGRGGYSQGKPDLGMVVQNLRRYAKRDLKQYSIGPISMRSAGGTQAASAAEMLEAWLTLKRTKKLSVSLMETILRGLGFNPKEKGIHFEQIGGRMCANVEMEILRDRRRCPLPMFGSDANGHYRVLVVTKRPAVEDILNDVSEVSHGAPIIVLHLGRMTEQRRRELAEQCRLRRKTFVVIDDALFLYLCGEHGSRLPVMFFNTLPFTYAEPFTSTAGIVSPEMFYGRERERFSVLDPRGSCFIFGGRQLGKTALLRDIERTAHAPERGRLVFWLDLKVEGIGYDRTPDELWTLLVRELKNKKAQVLPDNLPPNTGEDRVIQLIQTWLMQDPKRSIIFLLDEADRFLESDSRNEFVRTARLKGLMDRTDRRFKVVFAGLHNVQRTTRLTNNPLAHYGDPIRIGPLLDNGEFRQARALVTEPFRVLGYRFESTDLVTRILSQTNYYPSLIQLFCKQLLTHVSDSNRVPFDSRSTPPYTITATHVEDAYKNQDLRHNIRDRFMLTLNLDQRYRVIAFAIALYSLSVDPARVEDGFEDSWILSQVLTWWPDGFREGTSVEAFRSLLDEMVGLGVLRTTPAGHYALRSPNVIALLGTKPEIESELMSNADREAPPEYEPASFRMAYRNGDRRIDSRRSPLTAQQEAILRDMINGISVIYGNEAAGVAELKPFLSVAMGTAYFDYIDDKTTLTEFENRLAGLTERAADGVTLVLVSAGTDWNWNWVEAAMARIERLTSKKSFVRIAFIADAEHTWDLIDSVPKELNGKFSNISLRPWHDSAVRQWFIDHNWTIDKDGREKLYDITGNWPMLLQKFYERVHPEPDKWATALDALNNSIDERINSIQFARAFGLNARLRLSIFQVLCSYGKAELDEILVLCSDTDPAIVQRVLNWAEKLNLAHPVANNSWEPNLLVSRIALSISR